MGHDTEVVSSRLLALLALTTLLAACAEANTTPPPPTSLAPSPSPSTPPATVAPSPPTSSVPASPGVSPQPSPGPTFDPQAITLAFEPFAAGFGALTFLTHAGDGSGLLYAVEQAGVIRVLEPDGSPHSAPFLDISERVTAGGERGLLGLVFHPAFASNGRLFVNYTDRNGDTVVSEFARSGEGQADAGSERVLLSVGQPFGNHNGGMIAFGPDGNLYVSLGDGGGGGDPTGAGQDLSTLLGALLRIDVDSEQPYSVPADNPFLATEGARPEIWAWGLRNPWRFSFDRGSDALVIADVGQGAWEEINFEPTGSGGRNYGWNIMEGPECFGAQECDTSGLTMPVAWYPRGGGQCAVIGGYVYRGEQFPELAGGYLFADYCSGMIWALDSATALSARQATAHEVGSAGLRPTAFGEDENGELYLVGGNGEILRIIARPR